MGNLSTSATHLVSISHDPLEENMSAGLNQEPMARAGQRGFAGSRLPDSRRFGSRAQASAYMPDDWRPVLLAGAIGLFAAWVVSGTGRRPGARTMRGAEHAGGWRGMSPRAGASGRPSQAYREAGPEGRSSPHDFELDAMNP